MLKISVFKGRNMKASIIHGCLYKMQIPVVTILRADYKKYRPVTFQYAFIVLGILLFGCKKEKHARNVHRHPFCYTTQSWGIRELLKR